MYNKKLGGDNSSEALVMGLLKHSAGRKKNGISSFTTNYLFEENYETYIKIRQMQLQSFDTWLVASVPMIQQQPRVKGEYGVSPTWTVKKHS